MRDAEESFAEAFRSTESTRQQAGADAEVIAFLDERVRCLENEVEEATRARSNSKTRSAATGTLPSTSWPRPRTPCASTRSGGTAARVPQQKARKLGRLLHVKEVKTLAESNCFGGCSTTATGYGKGGGGARARARGAFFSIPTMDRRLLERRKRTSNAPAPPAARAPPNHRRKSRNSPQASSISFEVVVVRDLDPHQRPSRQALSTSSRARCSGSPSSSRRSYSARFDVWACSSVDVSSPYGSNIFDRAPPRILRRWATVFTSST